MDKVIIITGPTAVGKTAFSLKIASELKTEIINCDASQFRRGLDIGTAKIDLSSTNIKHHIIDIIDIEDDFSIKDFQSLAREKISEILKKKKIPLLVGGSGLYINAVIGDYDLSKEGRDPVFEKQFSSLTNEELHSYLEKLDPKQASIIHPNNRRRILRSLEVAFSGTSLSKNQNGENLLYNSLIICLNAPRDILYNRINERVDQLLDLGWLDEVKKLKSQGVKLQGIKDIGYSELNDFLDGKIDLETTKTIIRQKTRNYAKRQLTWFRNKMNCNFIEIDYHNPKKTELEVMNLIRDFLKNQS